MHFLQNAGFDYLKEKGLVLYFVFIYIRDVDENKKKIIFQYLGHFQHFYECFYKKNDKNLARTSFKEIPGKSTLLIAQKKNNGAINLDTQAHF